MTKASKWVEQVLARSRAQAAPASPLSGVWDAPSPYTQPSSVSMLMQQPPIPFRNAQMPAPTEQDYQAGEDGYFARLDAARAAAERDAQDGFGMGRLARPFTNMVVDPERRDVAGDFLQGVGEWALDDETPIIPESWLGREGEAVDSAAVAQNIGRGASEVARAAQPALGDFWDAATQGGLIQEYGPEILRGLTVGPWQDERQHQFELDYARSLGDEEAMREAANAANLDSVFAGLNAGFGAADVAGLAQFAGRRLGANVSRETAESAARGADDVVETPMPSPLSGVGDDTLLDAGSGGYAQAPDGGTSGSPMRLYRGVTNGDTRAGRYWTQDPRYASRHAMGQGEDGAAVMQTEATFRNPYRVTTKRESDMVEVPEQGGGQAWLDGLRTQGYDAVIDDIGNQVYVLDDAALPAVSPPQPRPRDLRPSQYGARGAPPLPPLRGGAHEVRGSERFWDDRLTPQQNKAVEMRRNGFTREEIAEELDTSTNTVSVALSNARRRGVDIGDLNSRPQADARGWTAADLFEMRQQGLSNQQISERTGASADSVAVRLSMESKRRGLPRREAHDDARMRSDPQLPAVSRGGSGLPLGDRVVRNPSGEQLIGLLNRADGHLRAVFDDSGMYVFDARNLIHKQGAEAAGIPYNTANRGDIRLVDGLPEISLPEEVMWTPEFLNHKGLSRYLRDRNVLFNSGSEGLMTGPEYARHLGGDTPQPTTNADGSGAASAVLAGIGLGGAAGYLATPQEAYASEGDPLAGIDFGPVVLGAGGGALAAALLRGRPVARELGNQAGMFAGINARTADRAALARAEEMAASGVGRDEIWNETGWFQGVDGKWRFEIDDSGATISGDGAMARRNAGAEGTLQTTFDASIMRHRADREGISVEQARANLERELRRPVPEEAVEMARHLSASDLKAEVDRLEAVADARFADDMTFGEVADHDDLFAAYPDLRERPYRMEGLGLGYGGRGAYNEADDAFYSSRFNDAEGERSTGLHEVQHSLQGREGFSRGGNTRQHFLYDAPEVAALRAERDALEVEMGTMTVLDPRFQDLNRRAHDLETQIENAAGFAGYRRLAGEVESRNVETRRDFTAEERRARPPWETQDVPDADQILRFDGDVAQMAGATARRMPEPEIVAEPRRTDLPDTVYHATLADVGGAPLRDSVDGSLGGGGAYASDSPSIIDDLIRNEDGTYPEGANIVPERVPSRDRYVPRDHLDQDMFDLAMRRGIDLDNPGDANLRALQDTLIERYKRQGYVGLIDPDYAGGAGERITWEASNRRAPWARMSERNRGSSDPFAGIAIGAGLTGAGVLAGVGDADAQEVLRDGRGLQPLPQGADMREGTWLGPWSDTALADGTPAVIRTIELPNGQAYTIVGTQSASGEIDFLGTVAPQEEPEPPSGSIVADPITEPYRGSVDMPRNEEWEGGQLNPLARISMATLLGLGGRAVGSRLGARGLAREASTIAPAVIGDAYFGGDAYEAGATGLGAAALARAPTLARSVLNGVGDVEGYAVRGIDFDPRYRARNIDDAGAPPVTEQALRGVEIQQRMARDAAAENYLPPNTLDMRVIGANSSPTPIGESFFDPTTGKPLFGTPPRTREPVARPPLDERAAQSGATGALQGVSASKLRTIAADLDIETQGVSAAELRRTLARTLGREFDSTKELIGFLSRYGVMGAAIGVGVGASDPLEGVGAN